MVALCLLSNPMQLLSKAQSLPSEPQKCTRGQVCAWRRSSMYTGSRRTGASTFQIPALPSFLASEKPQARLCETSPLCLPFSPPHLSPTPALTPLLFQPASSYHKACWDLSIWLQRTQFKGLRKFFQRLTLCQEL